MIFEFDFLHDGQVRWALGWVTPNYAGAFLACLLPWLWGAGRFVSRICKGEGSKPAMVANTSIWVLIIGLEIVLCFLISKTYSRGALVALGSAFVWFSVTSYMLNFAWLKRALLSAAILSACVIATGFTSRISGSYISADKAVGNRWELYQGGLQMIAAAPLSGWGEGESGRAYMNWFQDVERSEGFVTMVNSYLHIGVERGLPVLGVVLLGLFFLLILAGTKRKLGLGDARPQAAKEASADDSTRSAFQLAAGASLIAWAVANMFTTLWIEPKLWIVPSIAVAAIVMSAWSDRRKLRWGRVVGFCFGATSLLIIGLFVVGGVMLSKRSIAAKPLSDGSVLLSRRTPGIRCHAWLDTGVLGVFPGKEMRRWLEAMNGESESGKGLSQNEGKRSLSSVCEIVVHSPSGIESLPSSSSVILFGKQAERLWGIAKDRSTQVLIIHPTGALPKQESGGMPIDGTALTVLLPAVDETGDGARWRTWAESAGACVCISEGVGQDIRAVWPGVIMGLKKEGI
ncbi:MAG: O-antigen ligase family protein [Opitutaceae bacterium]|jgi:hypothetical protein